MYEELRFSGTIESVEESIMRLSWLSFFFNILYREWPNNLFYELIVLSLEESWVKFLNSFHRKIIVHTIDYIPYMILSKESLIFEKIGYLDHGK